MTDETVTARTGPQASKQIVTADVVVGLLTLNNAGTIEQVVKSIIEGLQRFFAGASAMIVNYDGGSQDGTPEIVERLAAGQVAVRVVPGAAGHYASLGTGFRSLGTGGRCPPSMRDGAVAPGQSVPRHRRAICAPCLLSGLSCWVALFIKTAMDFVVPLFRRHRYEGTLVSNLLYPLMRALYGKRLRYPSGGGYGLSGRLARELMKNPFWSRDVARISFDGWMTTVALAEGYQVCHAFLGVKEQDSKLGTSDLAHVLAAAVGAIFHSMEDYEPAWERSHESTDVPLYGAVDYAPLTGPVNIARMVSGVRQGVRDLLPLWEVILSPETLGQILALGIQESDEFHFP